MGSLWSVGQSFQFSHKIRHSSPCTEARLCYQFSFRSIGEVLGEFSSSVINTKLNKLLKNSFIQHCLKTRRMLHVRCVL